MELKRTKVNLGFWLFKCIVLAALLITILLHEKIAEILRYILNMEIYNLQTKYWIIAYISSYLLAYIVHFVPYYFVKNSKQNKSIKNSDLQKNFIVVTLFWFLIDDEGTTRKSSPNLNKFKGFILKLLSPDYSFAHTFKSILGSNSLNIECSGDRDHEECKDKDGLKGCELHAKKNRRKDFIIYSNWTNVIISCIFVFLTLIYEFKGFFLALLAFHMFSRIIEVVFSFYKDVVQAKMKKENNSIGYKSSNLKRGNRISLALHSYLEFILLFACLYYLLGDSLNKNFANGNMISFIDYLVYSMSVSAYNFSLDTAATTLGKTIHVSQVFTSMTLVVLSIATYIGLEDEMSDYEKKEWERGDYV